MSSRSTFRNKLFLVVTVFGLVFLGSFMLASCESLPDDVVDSVNAIIFSPTPKPTHTPTPTITRRHCLPTFPLMNNCLPPLLYPGIQILFKVLPSLQSTHCWLLRVMIIALF